MPQTAVADRMTVGIVGQLSNLSSMADAITGTAFSEEATAGIDVGLFVARGAAADGVLLPAAVANRLRGVSMQTHEFARGVELDADLKFTPGTHFGVLEVGTITVAPTTAVTPTSEVHVQMIAQVGFPAGSVRATGVAAFTLDITGLASWKTSALAGAPAELALDMTNIALAVAD